MSENSAICMFFVHKIAMLIPWEFSRKSYFKQDFIKAFFLQTIKNFIFGVLLLVLSSSSFIVQFLPKISLFSLIPSRASILELGILHKLHTFYQNRSSRFLSSSAYSHTFL